MASTVVRGGPVSAPPKPAKRRQEPTRSAGSRVDGALGVIEQVAGMMILASKTLVACITPPFTWRGDFIDEAFLVLKRCLFPVMISTTFFGLGAPGLQGGNLLNAFGSVDRSGAFFVMASVREFAPWINGMVMAGVAGTAICADLGARK